MPTYPISLHPRVYYGNNESKRRKGQYIHQCAKEVEQHVNEEFTKYIESHPLQIFHYASISHSTGIDEKVIERLLSSAGGGSNGIMVWEEGYDHAAHMREQDAKAEEELREFKVNSGDQSGD